MSAYYNEHDPRAAAWLRELIQRGLIAPGDVDERSILDVQPDDITGYTQCHFFAGIGGWSYALRLAGWPDDRPVWTGSPPCQPFSAAGLGKGRDDERHLAPHWTELVAACRPPVIFGEQVASAAVFGKAANGAKRATGGAPEWAWFDDLSDRLEAAHYAVGAGDIPAASIGAPHIRQRCFFGAVRLADADSGERGRVADGEGRLGNRTETGRDESDGQSQRCDRTRGLADAERDGRDWTRNIGTRWRNEPANERDARGMADCGIPGLEGQPWHGDDSDEPGRIGTDQARSVAQGDGARRLADADGRDASAERQQPGGQHGQQPQDSGVVQRDRPGPSHGFWDSADWLFCRDGKWRPVEPSSQRMANGLSYCLGRLRDCSDEEKRIIRNAEETAGFGREVLQAVRRSYGAEEIWRTIGGRVGFSETTILLAIVCEQSRELGEIFNSETQGSAQVGRRFLSEMRDPAPQIARSPQRYECPEQFARKLRDVVSELSQDCASFGKLVTDASRFNASPLSQKQPARVGRLRGYGNAIVPQAGAAFIGAFMEATRLA